MVEIICYICLWFFCLVSFAVHKYEINSLKVSLFITSLLLKAFKRIQSNMLFWDQLVPSSVEASFQLTAGLILMQNQVSLAKKEMQQMSLWIKLNGLAHKNSVFITFPGKEDPGASAWALNKGIYHMALRLRGKYRHAIKSKNHKWFTDLW